MASSFFSTSEAGALPTSPLPVLEHSAAGFAAEAAGFHILRQEGAGAEFFAERFVEVFEDVEAGVEADQVDEFERAHGVVQAEFEGFVDVFGCGDASWSM